MHALEHLCINKHAKFKVPSFTNSKDMIGDKIQNKLALYETDSLQLTFLPSSKSRDTKTRINIKNPAG